MRGGEAILRPIFIKENVLDRCVLTPRLLAVAQLAGPCHTLADVGTDHAHLPVYMILQGLCSFAFACDVNEGPLHRAKGAIAQFCLEDRIVPVRSDGLKSVPPEYDALAIAGMGGDLIARILYENPPVHAKKIVLQPMTKPEVLRRFLFRHGYSILRERAVSEGEKKYIVFSVEPVPSAGFAEEDCFLPQNLDCTPDALEYIEKLLNAHQRRLLGLRRAETEDREAISFEEEISARLTTLWQTYSRRLYDETH